MGLLGCLLCFIWSEGSVDFCCHRNWCSLRWGSDFHSLIPEPAVIKVPVIAGYFWSVEDCKQKKCRNLPASLSLHKLVLQPANPWDWPNCHRVHVTQRTHKLTTILCNTLKPETSQSYCNLECWLNSTYTWNIFFQNVFCSTDFLSPDWGNSMAFNLETDCFETKILAPPHIQNISIFSSQTKKEKFNSLTFCILLHSSLLFQRWYSLHPILPFSIDYFMEKESFSNMC